MTKVSLACKPPAESKTVIGMMDALGETLFRLAGFVDSIPVKVAGQTYKREVQTLANHIFEAVAGLLNAFLEVPDQSVLQIQHKNLTLKGVAQGLSRENNSSSSEGNNKDVYLIKTGIVWEACEIFEKASRSNREAVAKKWGDMMSTMEDAIAEVKEMIDNNDEKEGQDEQHDDDDESGNESDDSWNDDEKLTEEEKQLSIQANTHLKLTRLLLKKLQQRCLDNTQLSSNVVIPSPSAQESTSTSSHSSSSTVTLQPSDLARMWDQLYDRAQGIVALADEIATSLYSPQDQKALMELLKQLSRKNHDCILVGRLFVRGQTDQEQWMDMCEAQSKKILDAIVLSQS